MSLELGITYNQEGKRHVHGRGQDGCGGVKMACVGHHEVWVHPKGEELIHSFIPTFMHLFFQRTFREYLPPSRHWPRC